MATYRNTEVGQLQQTLNAMSQKCRRKRDKSVALKEKIAQFKEKAITQELSKIEAVKLNGMQSQYKHVLVELSCLEEEMKTLKELKEEKKLAQKQNKKDIFHDGEKSKEDDALLAEIYGINNENNEEILAFEQL